MRVPPPFLSVVTVALLVSSAEATTTRAFRQTTAKDFEEGEVTGSMVLPTGDVVAGSKARRVPLDATFVWCSVASPDGKTAYFAGGDTARIHAVPMQAAGGAEAAARQVALLDAPWVTALGVKPDGTLLAATTPGGRVFSVNPGTGTQTLLAQVGTDHVWALVHEPRTGITYAGTGGSGTIVAIDAQGKVRTVWDSGDKHIVSLLLLADGTLLAGTSDQAIVYRVAADGRAQALHDFDADEVRAIARTGTSTYLAVNDFEPSLDGGALGLASATTPKGTKIQVATGGTPASAGALPRPGQVKSKAAVYRLEDSGAIEQVASLADGYYTSLVALENGDVLAAAGTGGKIYRIAADRTVALVADLSERQALTLLRTRDAVGEGFLVGSGDTGGVYRVRPATAGEATYLSKVFDAEFPSRWGHLRWTGTPGLQFETRSGQTAKPDKTWADWRKLGGVTMQGGEAEGAIASASARYVQYRVTLSGRGALLRETTISYLAQNQRPRITDVTTESAGEKPTVPGATVARVHAAVLKLRWKVENPDGDELIYRASYRQESEKPWRALGGPDPLIKPEYDWNTESVPDGTYVVRVWTSDEKATPGDRALDFSFESPPFLVDNTRPEVTGLAAKESVISGRASDHASPITQIEYSVDGNEWRPAAPTDGILDQRTETFSLRLPTTLTKGAHVVTVRAFDATDNVGAAKITVETR